jgi:arylsulfatase A-like enzyme
MKVLALVASGLDAGHIGCYGNEWIQTPTLDRLAAGGIVFDQHYADHPALVAARRAWETGCYSFPAADEADDPRVSQAPELSAVFQEYGVITYLITEHSLGLRGVSPTAWNHLQPVAMEGGKTNPLQPAMTGVRAALDKLASVDRWLLKVELASLLPPWRVPEPFGSAYEDLDTATDEDGGAAAESRSSNEDADEAFLRLHHDYAKAVTYLDHELGILFDKLDSRKLDDLLILFTSDRGQALGERFLGQESQHLLNEEIVHLPLILRLPVQTGAGRRVFGLTQPVDLLPTLLELFGIRAPAAHGHSLLPLFSGKVERLRSYACAGLRVGDAIVQALRTPEWSLLLSGDVAAAPKLFVKPDDRWEVNDVYQHHTELGDRLKQTLHNFVAATKRPGPLVVPELPNLNEQKEPDDLPPAAKGGSQS